MTPQPVEAVFFFRYTKQVFQACYARLSESTRYTKNYIQVSGEPARVMDKVFGRSGTEKLDLEYVWPTGTQPEGGIRDHGGGETALRLDLYWKESGLSPDPWKVGSFNDPWVTIPGDPKKTTEAGADAEQETLTGRNLGPWLVAVKLQDDGPRLHVRAYLERPSAARTHTGIQVLPHDLLEAIHAVPANVQSGVFEPVAGATPPKSRATAIVEEVLEALEQDPNVLLVGPPGTGKTVALEDLRAIGEARDARLVFDPSHWHDGFSIGSPDSKAVSLVFHPSYAYENFVAGLFPETDAQGRLQLVAQPGPLVSLAQWTRGSDRRALLLLDEFNRGPTSSIFGDTLALLDASKREDVKLGQPGAQITRPYPDSQMLVANEFASQDGNRSVPVALRLPAGVQIVAALNSSDRSVAPLDAALRRRFAIIRVVPDLNVLAAHLGVTWSGGAFSPSNADPEAWTGDDVKLLALHLLDRMNERIASVLSDDFLLGHALFWPLGSVDAAILPGALCRTFDQRVLASLRITFTDQDELLAAVLGAGATDAVPPTSGRVGIWREPPDSVVEVSGPRLELRETSAMTWSVAAEALQAVVEA